MATPEHSSAADAATAPFDCSVVMSLFDKGPYVERALYSILQQTVPVREIVVVDGGSSDDGPARVAALAERHSVIRLICQIDDGVSEGRNRGIAEARGEWVAFLDGDDAYLPWYVEEMARLAGACPEAIFLGARCQEVPHLFELEDILSLDNGPDVQRGIVEHFYERWWHGNIFYTSSLCVRRRVLAEFDEPFPLGEHLGEDLDLFFRLAERGPLAATSRVGAAYAAGVPQGLSDVGAELNLLPSFQRLRARIDQPGFPDGERAGARRCVATKLLTVAKNRIRHGDPAGALAIMREPITAYRPSYWLRTAGLLVATQGRRALTGGTRARTR